MFDSSTRDFFQKRFSSSLGDLEWTELAEQMLCCFLERHHREVLEQGPAFLKTFLSSAGVSNLKLAEGYLSKKGRNPSLVVGDELGFIRREYPKSHHACYTPQSLEDARKAELRATHFFEDELQIAAYHQILVLELMEQLQRTGSVRILGMCLRRLLEACHPKGSILIVDRRRVQDDLVCQFVSLGAEIEELEAHGEEDFRLLVRP